MIKTPEQAWNDRRDEIAVSASRDFRSSVRPIYANSARLPKPQHVGSCLLLQIDGRPIVSTAAHIIDDLKNGLALYVGGVGGTNPVLIAGGALRTTTAPLGNRLQDHLDCAFWAPPDAAVAALGAVEFVKPSRVSANSAPVQGKLYQALGYPISRHKRAIDHSAASISNYLQPYTSGVEDMPALAAELKVSGAEHLFLRFDKYAHKADDSKVSAFGTRGLSGGALLDLGDFTSPAMFMRGAEHRAMLSGMLIEHKKRHHALVAVKIGPIVAGIRGALGSGD
jgi:hypothetical protein